MILALLILAILVFAVVSFSARERTIYVKEDSSRRLISSAQIARVLRENKQTKRDQP